MLTKWGKIMSKRAVLFLAPGFSRDFCSIFKCKIAKPQGGDGNEF